MWDYLTPKTLIAWQREKTLEVMGREAQALLAAGYPEDADRVLDALCERRRSWVERSV